MIVSQIWKQRVHQWLDRFWDHDWSSSPLWIRRLKTHPRHMHLAAQSLGVSFSPLFSALLLLLMPFVFKTGVHMKAVFWLGIMFLMQISCLRFKQSRISLLISHIYVLGCFVNFLVIFRYIWREIVFLKGLVKLMEIGNFEDLLLF